MYELKGIPMPPSMNNSYPTSKWGKRFKSRELLDWESRFNLWSWENRNYIVTLKDWFSIRRPGFGISLDCTYYFTKSRIICLNGLPKKLDLDNRIKHLLDSIMKLIDIDDSWIWSLKFCKAINQESHIGKEDTCSVVIEWVDTNSMSAPLCDYRAL